MMEMKRLGIFCIISFMLIGCKDRPTVGFKKIGNWIEIQNVGSQKKIGINEYRFEVNDSYKTNFDLFIIESSLDESDDKIRKISKNSISQQFSSEIFFTERLILSPDGKGIIELVCGFDKRVFSFLSANSYTFSCQADEIEDVFVSRLVHKIKTENSLMDCAVSCLVYEITSDQGKKILVYCVAES